MKKIKIIKIIPSSYTMITTLAYALLGILFLQLYDASGIERKILLLMKRTLLKQSIHNKQ